MSDANKYPVLGVSALVRRERQVLLVRRGRPPLAEMWAFPGGKVEFGETMQAAVAREVMEETGLTVSVVAPIDQAEIVLRDESGEPTRHFVLIVFAARWIAGEPVAGDDAADALWVDENDLSQFVKTPDTERILARILADRPG